MKLYLLFPLISSVTFVVAMLLLKRATSFRVGIWRTSFVVNMVTAILFLALLPLGGPPIELSLLWQPLLVAVAFFSGQVLTFLALEKGDVSIATPTMGVKTICVAWLSVLVLGIEIPWELWLSAVLTFAAIGLLSFRPGRKSIETVGSVREPSQVGRTILIALLAAISYALFDVLVQKWAPAWGAGRFLPIMLGMCGGLSLGFIPLFKEPIGAIPKKAWPWLVGGALLMGLQAISLVTSVALFGDATSINVIYSARGLWSVLAVWLIGHWFQNTEQNLGGEVMGMRLAGAAVMTVAIVVTLMS